MVRKDLNNVSKFQFPLSQPDLTVICRPQVETNLLTKLFLLTKWGCTEKKITTVVLCFCYTKIVSNIYGLICKCNQQTCWQCQKNITGQIFINGLNLFWKCWTPWQSMYMSYCSKWNKCCNFDTARKWINWFKWEWACKREKVHLCGSSP